MPREELDSLTDDEQEDAGLVDRDGQGVSAMGEANGVGAFKTDRWEEQVLTRTGDGCQLCADELETVARLLVVCGSRSERSAVWFLAFQRLDAEAAGRLADMTARRMMELLSSVRLRLQRAQERTWLHETLSTIHDPAKSKLPTLEPRSSRRRPRVARRMNGTKTSGGPAQVC